MVNDYKIKINWIHISQVNWKKLNRAQHSNISNIFNDLNCISNRMPDLIIMGGLSDWIYPCLFVLSQEICWQCKTHWLPGVIII